MRIISGVNKGRNLVGLGKGDPSAHLRPTSDRVRESIFNLIIGGRFGNKLENIEFEEIGKAISNIYKLLLSGTGPIDIKLNLFER